MKLVIVMKREDFLGEEGFSEGSSREIEEMKVEIA